MKPYRVPFHIRVNRLVMRPVFRALFHILGRVKISGAEHVPLGTPYIVAINHISIFDPPLAVAFWREPIEVVGAADVFEKKAQGPLLKMYGVIPVHRGDYDRTLLETMLAMLKAERPQLEMRIGKPIRFACITQTGKDRRMMRQHNADLVMRHIAGLLPEEYHGVYAGQAIAST